MTPIPILFIGDNPALPGGLARSGRDIATLAATMPEFRVGYLGRGLGQNRKLPFTVYDYPEGSWGQGMIEPVWRDFAGDARGVMLTTDDASRRRWFAYPNPDECGPALLEFLGPGRQFRKWGYFPLDGVGPLGRLGCEAAQAIAGYDRVLAASHFGANVLRSAGRRDADWLPHGIWPDRFKLVPNARELLGWEDRAVLGCVMANQSRKDWATAFDCARMLAEEFGNKFRFWTHTDVPIRYWNLYALAVDYDVAHCWELTTSLSDEQLAARYSGCAATILPSGGEGFGFPIAESLACGTHAIVTDYAGGAELVREDARVPPVAFRVAEGNVNRAVLSANGFAPRAAKAMRAKLEDWDGSADEAQRQVEHLEWPKLRRLWERWLREGLRGW